MGLMQVVFFLSAGRGSITSSWKVRIYGTSRTGSKISTLRVTESDLQGTLQELSHAGCTTAKVEGWNTLRNPKIGTDYIVKTDDVRRLPVFMGLMLDLSCF